MSVYPLNGKCMTGTAPHSWCYVKETCRGAKQTKDFYDRDFSFKMQDGTSPRRNTEVGAAAGTTIYYQECA